MGEKIVSNSKGTIYYGLHFYPGVAEYTELGGEVERVFINEDTIRSMDPTFAGRPVFVHHVNEVDQDINSLRGEADGWVIESFFNDADGKHWVKFLVVSDKGAQAVQSGYKLSNAYVMKSAGPGGLWNGVPYNQQILGAEYEHLAIVNNPRYEESVIMTPDQFKAYNEDKRQELKRIANSKKGESSMLNFFKKTKVENSADFENTVVVLPKSKQEVSISKLVNDMDEMAMSMADDGLMANGDHNVMVGEEKMKVNDLIEKHCAMKQELEDLKKKMEPKKENDEAADADAKKKALELAEHEEKEIEEAKDKKENDDEDKDKDKKDESKKENEEDAEKKELEKKQNAFFDSLKNAPAAALKVAPKVELSESKTARGKARYGSGN